LGGEKVHELHGSKWGWLQGRVKSPRGGNKRNKGRRIFGRAEKKKKKGSFGPVKKVTVSINQWTLQGRKGRLL